MDLTIVPNDELFRDVKRIIDEARQKVASVVNSTLTLMYWKIGQRINVDVLNGERAEYGKQIVATLSTQLKKASPKRTSQTIGIGSPTFRELLYR